MLYRVIGLAEEHTLSWTFRNNSQSLWRSYCPFTIRKQSVAQQVLPQYLEFSDQTFKTEMAGTQPSRHSCLAKPVVYLISRAYILFRILDARMSEKCCFWFLVSPSTGKHKKVKGWESVYHACVLSRFSHVQLFATLWTIAPQACCPCDSPGKTVYPIFPWIFKSYLKNQLITPEWANFFKEPDFKDWGEESMDILESSSFAHIGFFTAKS